jgi:hypothetical protein
LLQQTTHGKLQERKRPKRSPPPLPPPPPNIVINKITMQPTLGTSPHAMFIPNSTFNAQKISQLDQSSATRHLESLSLSLSLSLSHTLSFVHIIMSRFTSTFSFAGGSPLYLLERDPTQK